MHVGVVSFYDVDYGLYLANTLNEARVSVSLYLSRSHAITTLNGSDRPTDLIYARGLLDPDVKIRLFQLRRMRDPRSFAVMRRVSQCMRDDGIDVAHILVGGGEIWAAVLACLLRDIPVVSTMIIPQHNVGEFPPSFVVSAVNRLLVCGSEVIIVNGRDQVPLVQEMYKVPAARVGYVPLGPCTTLDRWLTKTMAEQAGTVLFFGRITPYKGLEYLVRAQPIITRHVPQARIVVAGSGKEELERCRQMMQDSTRFEIHEGFVPGEVAAQLFQRASVVALPYISASTSGILMTAYVFGKPVVVTRVGSLPEYVEDGVTGLLVPPAAVEQLADAVVGLLSDDALRRRMGKNVKRWVHHQQEKIAIQSLSTYEKAISMH